MAGDARALRGLSLVYPALWATRNRRLAGAPYSFAGREFLIDIHNDSRERVVFAKGNQVGGTVAAENIACCEIDSGNSVMWVFPTEKVASRHVKARFRPMLLASPNVAALFDESSSVEVFTAGEASLYFEGSNSKAGAHSVPVVRLIVDEVDRCDQDALDEFDKRMSGQEKPFRLDVSTPTLPDRGIAALFDRSDMKFWFLRCPDSLCSREGPLVWTDEPPEGWPDPVAVVRWPAFPRDQFPEVDDREEQASASWLECPDCGHRWTEEDRRREASAGRWVATHPGRAISGYWINQLCSPVRPVARIVLDYLEAAVSDKSRALQTFFNGDLGIAYLGKGEAITKAQTERLIVPAPPRNRGVPTTAAGFDIGSTKHGAIGGRVGDVLVAEFLEVRTFGEIRDLIRTRGLQSVVVDALPELDESERLCAEFPGVVFRCFTKEHQRIPDAWDSAHGIVDISRVSMTEFVHHRIRGRTLRILRNTKSKAAALHLTRVAVVETTNAAGDVVRIAKKLSRTDHFHWATVYLELASRRVGDTAAPLDDLGLEEVDEDAEFSSPWVDGWAERAMNESLGIGDLEGGRGSLIGGVEHPFSGW